MARQLLTALIHVRITALDAASIALHWTARTWGGDVGAELRRLADEMSERAKRLRGGY
jgi:hypothetical protein